jgi:hypothetical protein
MQKAERTAAQLSTEEEEHLWASFSRSYWNRLWIVQELLLVQQVVFICGCATFTWHDIQKGSLGDTYMSITRRAPNASALCQLFQKSKPLALSSALHLIHGKALFHCELPHDVVYGPVGLVSVDYSTSLTEVIVQVIDHALPSIVEVDPYKTPDWVLLSLELLLNVCYRSMGITQPRELDLRFLCSKVVKYYPWYNLHSRDFCSLYGRAW